MSRTKQHTRKNISRKPSTTTTVGRVAADTARIVRAIKKETAGITGLAGTTTRTAARTVKQGTRLLSKSGKRALGVVRSGTRGAIRIANTTSSGSLRAAKKIVKGTTSVANTAIKNTVGIATNATKGVVGIANTTTRGTFGIADEIVKDTSKLSKKALRTTFKVAKGAVRNTSNALEHSVTGTIGLVDGTAKMVGSSAGNVVDCGNIIASDFVGALTDVTTGLIDGASAVVDATGKITERVLNNLFDVHATHVFHGAGKLAKQIAESLGGVVRRVPVLGNIAGYIVESVGGGVYHLVLKVGKFITGAGVRTGKIVRKTTDLVVYTLSAGRNQITDTQESIDDILKRIADSVTTRRGKSLRSAGGGGMTYGKSLRRNK